VNSGSSLAAPVVIAMLVSACATTQGPPAPVEVPPGRIGVVVVGPPKQPSVPLNAAEAAAAYGLLHALHPPFFYLQSPIFAYAAGKCANAIYTAYPNLPSQFKEAVAREFSQEKLKATFVEEMRARTKSAVAPIEEGSGAGYFSHAAALTAGAQQAMDVVVELVEPVVTLGGADPQGGSCDYARLFFRVEVVTTRLKDRQVLYKNSVSADCTGSVSFETLGAWLNQRGALGGELESCYVKLASHLLDDDPIKYAEQLRLPEIPLYDLPAASTATESALPAYDATIPGKWVLVYDPSIRMPAANIDANGDVRTYRIAPYPALKWYLRHTIEPLFQEIQTEVKVPAASRLAPMGAAGAIVVHLDDLSVRWNCVEGAYTASSTVTVSLDARFADGRPLAAGTDYAVAQSNSVGRSDEQCSAEQVKPLIADAVHRSLDQGLRDIARRVASEAGLHEK
jgi:hypothetical protein